MTLQIDEENIPADPILRTFMDRRGVGHRRALPFDVAIRAEVHSEFTAMIGGNHVATCAKTWFFRIESRLWCYLLGHSPHTPQHRQAAVRQAVVSWQHLGVLRESRLPRL